MTTVYLDNCCFNRPFDDQLHPIIQMETRAKLLIQAEISIGKLNLVWSFMLNFENNDNPYKERREQIGRWEAIAGQVVTYAPQIETQANSIMTLGLKKKDAVHITCALAANADYFITTDKKVLNKNIVGIIIINPIDFIRRHMYGN